MRAPDDSYLRDVVAEVVAGKTERFEQVVILFRDRIYRLAWRMLQDRDDALDITQEVFLRAFRALRSWHGRARFSTWLHRIAVNVSLDFIRRRTKQRWLTGSFEEIEPSALQALEARNAPTDQPRRQAYAKQLRHEILCAVQGLPSRQRRCFVLRHGHECSIRDIAAVLNISEGAVKRHLHRATRRLRRVLAGRLSVPPG